MKKSELAHILRAACSITGDPNILVIGSQSILGKYPDAPASLRVSVEADVYPKNHPERVSHGLIDRAVLEERLPTMSIRIDQREAIAARIARLFANMP